MDGYGGECEDEFV